MTNPYQPPSSPSANKVSNQRSVLLFRPSRWAASYYVMLAVTFSTTSIGRMITDGQFGKPMSLYTAVWFAYLARRIFVRDNKARKMAIGLSLFLSGGIALVGLYMCTWSKIPGVNFGWFTINPTTVLQLLGLTVAGVLLFAIPALLLNCSAAKQEFSDS